jgi:hypothetical protein
MGNEYYNPQYNTNMYGQYGQPMQDRLMQMRNQYNPPAQGMPMNQGMPQGQGMPMPMPHMTASSLVKVLNAAEANGYVVAPGNTVYMVSKDYKEMYIKAVDMSGDPNMRYFRMQEYWPENVAAPAGEFVTRAEFDQLVAENNRMLAMIQQIMEGRNDERYANESCISADHAIRTAVQGRSENRGDEVD